MKKKLALALTAAMAVGTLAGCGSSTAQTTTSAQASAQATDKTEGGADTVETKPAPAGAKVVKFGNSGAIGEPAPQSCEEFCDLVNDKIGDRYYFEFYPAEQLGNETTMLENLQVGLQEGMMCALDTLATYESDLNILSMAFAFNNYDSMINYLKSDVADPIWESLDNQGIHVVNFEFQKNPRIFFANREIKSPKDMVGMKYRIPNLPIFEKNANGVGDENSSDSSTAPKTAQGVSSGDDTAAYTAYVYTVKTGDTLMSICKKHYGTTTKYTEVLKYNELDDANVLYVGQEIKLP